MRSNATQSSSPFQRGHVYCLPSLYARAEQWYQKEAQRLMMITTNNSQDTSLKKATRKQPSRKAKETHQATGPYTLSKVEADWLPTTPTVHNAPGKKRKRTHLPSPDPSIDSSSSPSPPPSAPATLYALTTSFTARLSQAILSAQQQQGHRQQAHSICALAARQWDCCQQQHHSSTEETYYLCHHGLALKSLQWVPRKLDALRPRIKAEMEAALLRGNEPATEWKKARWAKLRAVTLDRVAVCQQQQTAAMEEASMVASPTLGRWPDNVNGGGAGHCTWEEADALVRVEFGGLVFAVDECLGEARVFML